MSHRDQCQMAQFRELCGLLWLFHVRDKVSHHIRKVVRCESNKKVMSFTLIEQLSVFVKTKYREV